jgi:hypothetical protein
MLNNFIRTYYIYLYSIFFNKNLRITCKNNPINVDKNVSFISYLKSEANETKTKDGD